MPYKKLDLSARTLVNKAPALDNPILISAAINHCYTFGFSPTRVFQSNGETTNDWSELKKQVNLHSSTKQTSHDNQPLYFQSGWAGYIAYPNATQSLSPPQAVSYMAFYPATLLINIETDEVWLQNPGDLSTKQIADWLAPLEEAQSHKSALKKRDWSPQWGFAQYQTAFNQVQHYLKSGDCYQVNLTLPFYCKDDLTNSSPLPLLSEFKPAFGGYFKTQGITLFSVSPERFIQINHNRIETKPIKGTLPRGNTPEQDQQLSKELLDSHKNRAENLMIVDLLRNDISRSALPHTVKVDKLFALESHANVHHLVSTISAEKAPDKSSLDVVLDAFPGGSITGAPKKRAMEIIEELEIKPRGLYCGSLGYFDEAGHSDFNILIRSIVATKQGAECWGGGGVTIDSTADDEYQEIMNKVGKILSTPL